jgi:hypothetical protein
VATVKAEQRDKNRDGYGHGHGQVQARMAAAPSLYQVQHPQPGTRMREWGAPGPTESCWPADNGDHAGSRPAQPVSNPSTLPHQEMCVLTLLRSCFPELMHTYLNSAPTRPASDRERAYEYEKPKAIDYSPRDHGYMRANDDLRMRTRHKRGSRQTARSGATVAMFLPTLPSSLSFTRLCFSKT